MAQLLGGLDNPRLLDVAKGRQLDADDDALYSVLAALTAGAQRLSIEEVGKLLVSDVAPAAAAQFHHLLSVALSSTTTSRRARSP